MNLVKARYNMIEQQIRSGGIQAPNVLKAFESLDRERFFSSIYVNIVYEDVALPIGNGYQCLRPETIGHFFEMTHLSENDKVLFIGEQSGYPAALASLIAKQVTCLCQHDIELKENLNANHIVGVNVIQGRFEDYVDTIGTFDVVYFTSRLMEPPHQALDLLNLGGRFVAVMTDPPPIMSVLLVTLEADRQVIIEDKLIYSAPRSIEQF